MWSEHFAPYGEKLNGAAGKIGYTGHAHDSESGLTYAQARFYDPVIGRFLSIDPIGFTDDPFTFGRYGYGNGNPYRYTDPTGMAGIKIDVPVREHMVTTTSANADGSQSVSRSAAANNGVAVDGSVSDAGKIKLLPQDSNNGAPAVVTQDMQKSLLNFSEKEGKSVSVTSGTRTPEQNSAVGGSPNSAHLANQAADIAIENMSPAQTAEAAFQSGEFNRVNEYTDGRGVHVDMKETGRQERFIDWKRQ